jgi:hypothetical protein
MYTPKHKLDASLDNYSERLLWAILEADHDNFPRHRSITIETQDQWDNVFNDPMICWYSRIGGGNRDYQDQIVKIREHPLYSYDRDDTSDVTYARFYFNFPRERMRGITRKLKIFSLSCIGIRNECVYC